MVFRTSNSLYLLQQWATIKLTLKWTTTNSLCNNPWCLLPNNSQLWSMDSLWWTLWWQWCQHKHKTQHCSATSKSVKILANFSANGQAHVAAVVLMVAAKIEFACTIGRQIRDSLSQTMWTIVNKSQVKRASDAIKIFWKQRIKPRKRFATAGSSSPLWWFSSASCPWSLFLQWIEPLKTTDSSKTLMITDRNRF